MNNLKFKYINLSNDILEPINIDAILKKANDNYCSISKEVLSEYLKNESLQNLVFLLPFTEADELNNYEDSIIRSLEDRRAMVVLWDDEKSIRSLEYTPSLPTIVMNVQEITNFIGFLENISKESFISFDAEAFWNQIFQNRWYAFAFGKGDEVVPALSSMTRSIQEQPLNIENSTNFTLCIHSHADASCADFELISNMFSRIVPDGTNTIWSAVLEEDISGYEIGLLYG